MNGNGLVKDLERTSARWPAATAARVDKFIKQKVGDAAGVQSRRVLAAANAELANRALHRFFELLYDETADGVLCNIGEEGRVLIPAPWSRTRHDAYGLTDHGARVLRSIMTARLAAMPWRFQVMHLDAAAGRWRVNLKHYGNLAAALGWLDQWPVTADLWLKHNDAMPRRGRG